MSDEQEERSIKKSPEQKTGTKSRTHKQKSVLRSGRNRFAEKTNPPYERKNLEEGN